MPSWKKIIVSGSDASLNSLNVSTSLTASGLNYPTTDNGEESYIQTDGSGNLSFQYVKTIYEEIYNGEASTILKGTPVYVSGSVGAASVVYRADAGDPTKMPVIYITADTINSAGTGRGIALGLIKGVDTTGYPAGTEIYLAVGGGWTSTRPTGSAIVQVLGYVTKEGAGGQGVILNPGPNSIPNLTSGSVWVGNSNSIPIAVTTSSLNVLSAQTASYVNPLNQNVIITGSLVIGSSSLGPFENTLTLGARDAVQEGGQIGFNASGGTYTSASFIDLYQNRLRILKGTNATSTGEVANWNMHNLQMALPAYTSVSAFPGTAAANLAVDTSGNIITVSTTGGTVFPYVGNAIITGSLSVTGITQGSYSNTVLIDTASGQLYYTASSAIGGSPSNTFPYTGSAVISGSLAVTNNITIENALYTSTTTEANIGSTTIYSVSTSSYDGAWFEYTARSGSNARAGQIMSIWSGSQVNFTETTTTDFGSTAGLSLGVFIVNGAMALTASADTNGWNIKTIVRSI